MEFIEVFRLRRALGGQKDDSALQYEFAEQMAGNSRKAL
jgi:hypothetical protein